MNDVAAGTRLGPYEIIRPIGAGGMGEVWSARDSRLERNVAIKILPAALAHDPLFRARFEREAKTISQLNHPHICQIYDVGEATNEGRSPSLYLVMELLEGENLADRISRGALPLQDALRHGTHIADALAAAHRAGIVHRDLKPGNIVITKAGAKLLDFGLAKATAASSSIVEGAASSAATQQRPLTQEGTIVGTFQYMTPEQLEGLEADARSDIFAFGTVLYEMVTGRRAFEGKNKTSLIAAIVEHDPAPISQFQPLTPPAFERLVRTCLEKDPENRWQTAHDLLLQLRWIAEAGSQAGVAAPVVVRRKNRERLAWGLALVLLAATTTFAFLWQRLGKQPVRRVETSILPPENATFEFNRGPMVLSPDGQKLVYVARAGGKLQLWLRRLNVAVSQPLSGTDGAAYPFWSPDSRFVGFFASGNLRKIDTAGGPPQDVCEAANGRGGTWNRDGIILFAPTDRDPLFRVPATGGKPVALTRLADETEYSHRFPSFLPDGRHFLFLAQRGASGVQERGRIYLGTLGTSQRKELVVTDSQAVFAPPGYLLYARDRALIAHPFDLKKLETAGDAFPVAEQVQYFPASGAAAFSAATNGTITFQAGSSSGLTRLLWFDRTGKPLGVTGSPSQNSAIRISHKGDRVAYELLDANGGSSDIWIHDLVRSTSTRFTFDPGREGSPVWSPDDSRIVYAGANPTRTTRTLAQKISSGAGRDELLLSQGTGALSAVDISRDGRYLSFHQLDYKSKNSNDVWIYSFEERKAYPYVQSRFRERGGLFSPDTRWIAYVSDESGRDEVYVQPFPATGAKWQISTTGGLGARWCRNGKEIFYISSDNKVRAAAVTSNASSFSVGVPQILFDLKTRVVGMDVTENCEKVLVNQPIDSEAPPPITVILNWTAELEK